MGLYSKYLGDTLAARLETMLEQPVTSQVSLFEELALVRTHAIESIKMWNLAVENEADSKSIALAMDLVKDALREVKDFCMAVNRIEKDAEDKVSMGIVQVFIDQIVRVIFRVCGEKHVGLAERIRLGIDENVKLPRSSDALVIEGTDSTPDQMVTEMDESSAPKGAECEDAESTDIPG